MKKAVNSRDRLNRVVSAIERGQFELIDCDVVADKSEPGRYVVRVFLERLVAEGKPNKKPPRQTKVRELIFDDED